MSHTNFLAVVLAAGYSKRFKAATNKLMMPLCGRPLVYYPLKALCDNNADINIVVGQHTNYLKQTVLECKFNKSMSFSYQKAPLGTGDALLKTNELWHKYDHVIVVNGDMPLVTGQLIKTLITEHTKTNAVASIVSAAVLNPTGYGRIVETDSHVTIVEERDCTPAQKNICKINAGLYIFERNFLEQAIPLLTNVNASGEFYITDLVGIASEQGKTVSLVHAPFEQVQGVNTIEEFWAAEQLLKNTIISQWMAQGVHFENPYNLHIDIDVTIGSNARISGGAVLLRGSHIGSGCVVNAFSILANAQVDQNTVIKSHTVVQDSAIGKHCNIGPFARIRNNTVIKDNVVVENFAEINHCTLENGTLVRQMCYLEEVTIAANTNVSQINHTPLTNEHSPEELLNKQLL